MLSAQVVFSGIYWLGINRTAKKNQLKKSIFFLGVKLKTDIREIHLKERVTVSTLGILFGDKKCA